MNMVLTNIETDKKPCYYRGDYLGCYRITSTNIRCSSEQGRIKTVREYGAWKNVQLHKSVTRFGYLK